MKKIKEYVEEMNNLRSKINNSIPSNIEAEQKITIKVELIKIGHSLQSIMNELK